MINIKFTGDLMCAEEMTDFVKNDYSQFFADIKKDLSDSDYTVVNLETPIAGEKLQYTHELFSFNSPDSFLDAIKDCGVNMVALANNHCMDRKEEGIKNTLIKCREYGFDTVGLNLTKEERDKIFVKEIGGIKVAFINYTYGTNAFSHGDFLTNKYMVNLFQPEETLKGSIHLLENEEFIASKVQDIYYLHNEEYDIVLPYLEKLKRDIQKAKEISDYVILMAHCGGQRNDEPDSYSKFIMNTAIQYGVDFIVGNHAHIIQKSEIINSKFVSYCLGNFMFVKKNYDKCELDMDYSILLNLYLDKVDGKITTKITFQVVYLNANNELPYPINTYELYNKTNSKLLKEKTLFFANRFVDKKDFYKEIKNEYEIEV